MHTQSWLNSKNRLNSKKLQNSRYFFIEQSLKKSGATLVALAVTMIVLLILTGIGIAILEININASFFLKKY